MSSTNRGAVRSGADYYPTPAWCTRRLLEARSDLLHASTFLEPGAGMGHIVRAVLDKKPHAQITAVEIREECTKALIEAGAQNVQCGPDSNFLSGRFREWPRFDVAIGNPPYGLAMEFIEEALRVADVVAFLLRLNFLGSQGRAPFHHAHPASVYVLPDRPSFTGKGTDSIEYAWFVWERFAPGSFGEVRVLPLTPEAEKKADAGQLGLYL